MYIKVLPVYPFRVPPPHKGRQELYEVECLPGAILEYAYLTRGLAWPPVRYLVTG